MASITIPLFYDLDLLRFTTAAGGIARQPNLVLGQSDSIAFAVQFVRSGVVIELTNPQWICGIKPINDVAGDYLCQTTTGVKTGSTTTTVYTFTLLLDSTELRAWLLTVTAVSNYAAFSIRDTVNLIATLPAITCTILPDYTLAGTTPTAASGTLIVASGQTFTVNKTFAMPTDDGQNNYVLKTNGAGVGSWAADNAGTGSVTSVGLSVAGGGTVLSITGTPVTSSGTLGIIVAGTSGGLLYFSSGNTMGSTATLGLGALIVGGGAGATPTAVAAVASGRVLTSSGTLTNPAYSSTITLGASGTLGTITLGNATVGGGTMLLQPPTGSISGATITLPSTTTILAGLSPSQIFTSTNTFSSPTASTSTGSGAVVISTGGLGVGGNAYVGGVINIPATTSTAGQITQVGIRLLHTYGTAGNFFAGPLAGTLTSSGAGHNCGVGYGSLASLGASGGFNTGLGSFSLNGVTTGSGNMGIGYGAAGGQNCSNNTAIGFQSLQNNTGGSNTAVGFNTGQGVAGDTPIGGLVSLLITTGSNNTLLGNNAGITLASGTYRTAIGSGSRCQSNNAIKLGRDYSATNAGDITILGQIPVANLPAASADNKGAIVYNSTDNVLYFSNGTSWQAV